MHKQIEIIDALDHPLQAKDIGDFNMRFEDTTLTHIGT